MLPGLNAGISFWIARERSAAVRPLLRIIERRRVAKSSSGKSRESDVGLGDCTSEAGEDIFLFAMCLSAYASSSTVDTCRQRSLAA